MRPSDARGANKSLTGARQVGSLPEAIADVYVQVRAPSWAAPNADGLVDVLRDLSWMPAGPVTIRVPLRFAMGDSELSHLIKVLMTAEADTAHGPHPVARDRRLTRGGRAAAPSPSRARRRAHWTGAVHASAG